MLVTGGLQDVMYGLWIRYPELRLCQEEPTSRRTTSDKILTCSSCGCNDIDGGQYRTLTPIVSATYPKRSLYTGYTTEFLLPEKFRLCGILAQQILKVACGSSATRSLERV
jgi:hypothetical protein